MLFRSVLYLALKSTDGAFHTLEELRRNGYNATVMTTESLRHIVEDFPEENHFLNLRHIEQKDLLESVFCLFVIDDNQLENIKSLIRELTKNFVEVKGYMFSREIEDYEGSI